MGYRILDPGSWLYTDRMNDIGSDEIIAELRRSWSRLQEEEPIIVVPVQEMPGKFAIVSGNHRALIAERDQKPITARVIENDEDIASIHDIAQAWEEDIDADDDTCHKSRYQRVTSQVVQAALSLYRRKQRR